ncbi:formyltransferase family protein [Halarcobacter sp.]|uniref:formyltransferase family protein n=1 Tax=Halarcobacter sp. TaxID=2321133 RepID=UPI0029F4C8E8|nr:formyltransferase family protein [Halarcobacter sp.]
MNNISFIGTCNFRTYFYLQSLKNNNISLQNVIIYDYKNLDISKFLNKQISYKNHYINIYESLESLLDFYNAEIIKKNSINNMKEEIKKIKTDFFIFSGKSGEIVKEHILYCNKFLHIHPGKLPSYRGSTTIYYSLLNESKCFASAFFLDKKIDAGKIIKQMEFDIIDIDFDYLYDSFIRSYLLIDILINAETKTTEQVGKIKEYYIIHPVLKKLALIKKEKVLKNEKNF